MREEHQEHGWEDDGGAVPPDPDHGPHMTYTRDQLDDLRADEEPITLDGADEPDPTDTENA